LCCALDAAEKEIERLKSALPAIPLDRERIIEAIENLCYQQMQNVGTWRDKLLSAPVPAPRLEWTERKSGVFVSGRWRVLRYPMFAVLSFANDWGRRVDMFKCDSVGEAQSLAQKLNDVLSPPVGTQE